MATIRVIPCLDVKDGRVVKGVNFVNLRDAGDPAELARRYEEQGADELVFLDISATVEERATTIGMVRELADAITIPFTVGGGVRSVEDANRLIGAGATKVGVNSAALATPSLVDEISGERGSASLVIAIDVKRDDAAPSGYVVVTHGGQRSSGIDARAWAVDVAQRGAGEILLTSLEADGTLQGYDLDITRIIAESSGLPVIASGGAGRLEHFAPAAQAGAQGVLAASVFHDGTLRIVDVKRALSDAGFTVLS